MGSGLVTVCFGTPSLQLPNSPSAQACRGVGELADFDYSTPQVRRRAGSWGVGDLGICRVAKLRKNGDWRKYQDGLCEMGSGIVTGCFGTPSPQLPKCAGVPGSWGVGDLADFVYSTPQVRRRAGELGSWGVGELAWVSASCMVEGEFCCWQLLERHTAGRGHGSTLWKMDGCRIKGAAVLGCKSSQWHLKLFWLFNEAIKCWQVPDQVANRVNVWNNCDLVAMLPICSFCAGIPEKAAQTHP